MSAVVHSQYPTSGSLLSVKTFVVRISFLALVLVVLQFISGKDLCRFLQVSRLKVCRLCAINERSENDEWTGSTSIR